MTALLIYLAVALGFSFLCSIAEAVLLSITTAYVKLLDEQGKPSANILQSLKTDIEAPLSAILSLNTIAHTVGAAGVGAQSAKVFGSGAIGLTSAVLTLLILFFSEIIPKTLGSRYWRQLAPATAYTLKYLVIVLYPLVWVSRLLTRSFASHTSLEGFSRDEFAAMANLGEQEGQLAPSEARILNNLFKLNELHVEDVYTPNTVMFKLQASCSVEFYFNKYKNSRFSRIPIYSKDPDTIEGFVLRSDLLLARARDNGNNAISTYQREMHGVLDKLSLLGCFEVFVSKNTHILYVVDEYGSLKGLITMEDIFETLVGLEIVDEGDKAEDLRKVARQRWRKRAETMGIEWSNE
ncbi:CNNM domain-containing protein [Aurantivibrio plasticivorans]